jgi:translocation and assembly module TamB
MIRARLPIPIVAILLLGFVLAWLGLGIAVRAQSETTVLGNLISRALSTPTTQVSIGAVDGALSSDATIRNVVISDRDGPWLRLDRARLIWRRTALLARRLEIDRLEVGRLEILRRPAPSEQPVPASDEPLLPELPVRVEVRAFQVTELSLGEPVLGVTARLGATGSARLGNPAEGLALDLEARRRDAPGQFTVRLGFVPQGERLDVVVNLEEPAGGLAARLARIPDLPPVRLDLRGNGVLDDWRAALTFQAGPGTGATGEARLLRAAAERRLTLDLTGTFEGLLPAPAAAVFSGTTRLQGATRFGDTGAISLDELTLTSRTARLAVNGSLSADQVLDVTAEVRALPTDGQVTRAGSGELERLVFDARAQGPLLSPRINGRLDAAGLRLPQGSFGQLQADLSADPEPRNAAGETRFAVRAEARASGLALADPALRNAIGERAEFTLRGVFATDGIGDVEVLRVASSNANLSYQGRLGQTALAGTLQAEFPRLAAFSGLAGRRLAGSLRATARLDGNPDTRSVRAEIDAQGQGLSVAQPALDRLTGGRLALNGVLRTLPDGYGFEGIRLEGAFLEGRLDGQATQVTADVTARLDLRDLAKVDPALAGRADLIGRLTGSLARPDVTATLTTADARALGRPLRDLRAEATLQDVTGLMSGNVAVTGAIGAKPLRASARLRRGQDPLWALEGLEVVVGSATIIGQASILPGDLVDGMLRIAAADLDELSPLVLTPLSGSLNADLNLVGRDGRQDVQLQARGRAVRAFGVVLAGLDADIAATDLRGRPMINGQIMADRLQVGGEDFSRIRLVAQGMPQATDLSLEAEARGFRLSGMATLIPRDRIRLAIANLSAERGRDRLALAQPAAIVLDGGAVIVENVVVAAGTGRITLAGRIGDNADLAISIRALPLSVADVVRPGLGLAGTLEGDAELKGALARPEGRYRLNLTRFTAPQTRDLGLPPIEATASGNLGGGRAGIDARVNAGSGVQLAIDGSVPTDAEGALAVTVKGRADVGLANAFLGASGQRVAGRLDIDAALAGTPQSPRVEGRATLSGGSFTDFLQGIRLADIQGRFVGRGEEITVERLTATTRNGGTLAVAGRVTTDAQAGFPGSLRITARRAELVASDIVDATTNLDLTLEGPLTRTPRIAGRVDLVTMNVAVPDRLPATIQPLPGTRHIAPPPRVGAILAAERREQAQRAKARPFDATLDLVISAPNRIFVRGRGLDAELGGDLRLTGTSRDPVAIGAFELRRGRFTILGQRLDFTRGRLDFTGGLAPDLDFVAETSTTGITARVAISGPASQPDFELTSDPPLPQDEVLSRLLFQKASGSLSGFQALQLAEAVAQLAGGGSGPDAFERTRRALGVDSLDITAGAEGGPAIGASRYIGDRLSVGVKAGARPEDSGVTVGIDVTRRLKVQGEIGVDGRSAIGIGAEWEY